MVDEVILSGHKLQYFDEIWKDIEGYEGLYQVSNYGRVKSLKNKSNHKNELIMKQAIVCGYKKICLSKNSIQKMYSVHRLVAIAFIKNPLNKEEVNHKDGNKQNNKANNLEWVTSSENMKHAFKKRLSKQKIGKENPRSIQVVKISLKSGKELKVYGSLHEAERKTGVKYTNISKCINGEYKQAGGYKWKKK